MISGHSCSALSAKCCFFSLSTKILYLSSLSVSRSSLARSKWTLYFSVFTACSKWVEKNIVYMLMSSVNGIYRVILYKNVQKRLLFLGMHLSVPLVLISWVRVNFTSYKYIKQSISCSTNRIRHQNHLHIFRSNLVMAAFSPATHAVAAFAKLSKQYFVNQKRTNEQIKWMGYMVIWVERWYWLKHDKNGLSPKLFQQWKKTNRKRKSDTEYVTWIYLMW